MMAPTHLAFGVLTSTSLFALFGRSLHQDWPALGCTMLGSLLPDVDSPKSALGRLLPFVSVPLERRFGHRTVTHSLLALGVLGLLLLPLTFFRASAYLALLLGYASHLMADCATQSGVPLFYPHPSVYVLPGNPRYRFHTGSLSEQGLLLVLLLLLGLVFPLSQLGGAWKALRYLMATQSAAYQDFRQESGEALLSFKGRWRESRQPVEGEALILEGSPSRFLIAFQGQVLVYGEQGDILPDHSRVQSTGRPVRVDTLRVKDQPFEQVLEQIPEGAFVSGRLESAVEFFVGAGLGPALLLPGQHPALKIQDKALEFEFAPREFVARPHPRRQVDPERLERLQHQVEDQKLSLEALNLRRPPVHYLELRSAQARLEAVQRELAGLQDLTVRFGGVLYVRQDVGATLRGRPPAAGKGPE